MSWSREGARATRTSTRREEADSQKLEAEMVRLLQVSKISLFLLPQDIFQQIAGRTGESLEAVCNMAEGERSHLVKVSSKELGSSYFLFPFFPKLL